MKFSLALIWLIQKRMINEYVTVSLILPEFMICNLFYILDLTTFLQEGYTFYVECYNSYVLIHCSNLI